MVNIGFIVEGDSERILLESEMFVNWLAENNLTCSRPIIDAEGREKLFDSGRLDNYIRLCQRGKPEPDQIVVLLDFEDDPCFTSIKERITPTTFEKPVICIAKKAIESWYLADRQAMCEWFKSSEYNYQTPEIMDKKPHEFLKQFCEEFRVRGPGGSKPLFARNMINKYKFSIDRAASHPHCPSATYFLNKLKSFASL